MIWMVLLAVLSEEAGAGPDPAPYGRIVAEAQWEGGSGRWLACILGEHGSERGLALAVYRQEGERWIRVFLDRDRGTHPWSLRIAELDGDQAPELLVGVHKRSRFDPVERNRLFVYDWRENGQLFPKWLGSRLGLEWVAFETARAADGKDRLLTIERGQGRRMVLRQYRWNGFGFSHERDRLRIRHAGDELAALDELRTELARIKRKGAEP